MSRKRTVYTAAFKSKLVLEVLANEQSLSAIASAHNVTPKNLQNWKKTFLDNAEIAMEPSKAVKEYKVDLAASQEQNEALTKIVGRMTVEKEWLEKKLKSLGLSERKSMIEPKHETISVLRQCSLLGVNRSSHYYQVRENNSKVAIKDKIVDIFEQIPIYGAAKVHQQLLEDGFKVSLNTVASYRQDLGLKAVLAVKQVNTTVPIKAHKKYNYKLRGLDISRANQALAHYGQPEIFNTDQGSQYASNVHTQRLKNKGIIISMDGKGRATDNICIERFWRSAKCERIYLNEYHSLTALKTDVADYIDFYNHKRFHETLKYKKPMNVYHESIVNQIELKKAA